MMQFLDAQPLNFDTKEVQIPKDIAQNLPDIYEENEATEQALLADAFAGPFTDTATEADLSDFSRHAPYTSVPF